MTDTGMHVESEVYAANASFYEALSSSDMGLMERVWSHGREVRCIHPGWEVLIGWRSIHDAWDAIFASSPGLRVHPRDVEIVVAGEMAWVHCLEEIRSGAEPGGGSAEPGGERSFARSTNLFRNTPQGWKMILHHASPIPGDPTSVDDGAVH